MQVSALTAVAAAAPAAEATAKPPGEAATPVPASPEAAASRETQRGADGRAELLYLEQAHAVAQLTGAVPGAEPVAQLYRALAAGEMNGTLVDANGQITGYWLQILV